jgi:hypothetical protein
MEKDGRVAVMRIGGREARRVSGWPLSLVAPEASAFAPVN